MHPAPHLCSMKTKSQSIRVIRAALERHNRWVRDQRDRAHLEINKGAVETNRGLINEANQLLLAVHELSKKLTKLGLHVTYENSYGTASKPMRMEVSVLQSDLRKYAKAQGITVPVEMTEDELILAMAEMEENSMAEALDKLKLHWRK